MIKGNASKQSQTMGMIVFFQKENKIKIHVNLNLLRKNALDISAKLLEVADVYEGEFND
jgi:hypothetical protein